MKYSRVILCLIIVLSIVLTISTGGKKIAKDKATEEQKGYKCLLTLWQVDTFEGGKGSRKQFLSNIAKGFERKNDGVLLTVLNISPTVANDKMKDGVFPDMISFGVGVETENMKKLNITKNVKGCVREGKCYFTAWNKGSYFLFRNKKQSKKKDYKDSITVSKNRYTNPLATLLESDKQFARYEIKVPKEAFMAFYSGESEYLLGTQRDVERLNSLQMDVEITELPTFNDLISYIAVLSDDREKIIYSELFIKYLLDEENQKKLSQISMFSPYYKIEFENEGLNGVKLSDGYLTVSPFQSKEKTEELSTLLEMRIIEKKDNLNKIKNLLV